MTVRSPAVEAATEPVSRASERFGVFVFSRSVIQKMLPPNVYKNVVNAMDGLEKIRPEYADAIAMAMKEWAVSLGATHFSHWFQPLTGASAEKHDAFIDWLSPDKVIEKFGGKQLMQGEPDASSFPSGGLRSTYEARGYTGWDPGSPAFVWKAGDGMTLCIPSAFYSWTGDVLDTKIPLLRSDSKLNTAVMRLLHLTGIQAGHSYSTLGLEQEYFVIDRALRDKRPDLLLTGRTLFGAPSAKGQELQDHYFGAVQDRILGYMSDFENRALSLGIPLKTRHNEVAPAQHEVAPVYEKASLAVDHNILLMELMRQTARRRGLACLLHEKPFAGLNGSGKHANWSIMTDTGLNLFDPTDTPENQLHFLILLTAVIHAVRRHQVLMRASISSASNDLRLGGHEAPPAIMSVYLGKTLENLLDNIAQTGSHKSSGKKGSFDLGIPMISEMPKDNTDRNRTSPMAFTGNKFEFRAVGSSANAAFPITVLNTIVAESLTEILDEIEQSIDGRSASKAHGALATAAMRVLPKYIKAAKSVLFDGDNYSEEWKIEAHSRGLPNIHKSVDAFEGLTLPSTIKAFEGVLREHELASRQEIMAEMYGHHLHIEAKLMAELFITNVLPAGIKHSQLLAQNISATSTVLDWEAGCAEQRRLLAALQEAIEEGCETALKLRLAYQHAAALPVLQRARAFSDEVLPLCSAVRHSADVLETLVDSSLWPWPKYRELLFLV